MDVEAAVGSDMRFLSALVLLLAGTVARADSFFVVVSGLGGEQEYEQRFSGWAKDIDKIVKGELNAHVDTLTGPEATKGNIEGKLKALANTA